MKCLNLVNFFQGYKFKGWSKVVMINKSDNNSIVTDENGKNVYANVNYGKDSQTVTLTCPDMDKYYGKNMAIVLYNGMRVADKSNIRTSYSSIIAENTTANPRLNYKTYFNNVSNSSNSVQSFKDACNRSEVGNMSMTANWTAHTYNIQFNSNNGKDETKTQTGFKYGTSQKLDLNTFENLGYSFKGWAVSQDNANSGIVKYLDGESVKNLTTVNKDTVKLYAVWEKKTYTVKFNANGGQGTMPDMTCYYGVSYTPKCTFSNGLKSFTGWSTIPISDTDFITFQISDIIGANDNEITLYAQWANNTNTVVYHANNGSNEIKSSNFLAGSDLTLARNTFTRQGYKFKGWSKSATTERVEYKDQETIKSVFVNLELYAVWEKVVDTYTIKFNANGGEGSIADQQGRYGEVVTLPNRKAEEFYKTGYCFIGWSKRADATEAEYNNCGSYIDNTREEEREENKEVTLYAVWVKIPVSAQDIYLEYEDIYLINDEIFMGQEADITVSENKYNITLAKSEITNLDDAKNNAQENADDGSEYDLNANIVYSTGDKTEITFKLYVAEETHPTPKDNGASIRYIRKDTINSLRNTSEWLKSDKNALLRDVLNKDLSKLKSYKVTKAKL